MKNETHFFYKYIFKQAAVKVANHSNIQTKDVADALDIHPFMLSRWKKQAREGVLKKDSIKQPTKSVSKSELRAAKKKIRSLEEKMKRLQQENTVLKKAERLFPGKK